MRFDDELIVEPYSPHRFSRQIFGNCQDAPGALIEHHYDGSLLALVQLWDSCVHLGCSSKIIIPMRLSKKGSLMTSEYFILVAIPSRDSAKTKYPHNFERPQKR